MFRFSISFFRFLCKLKNIFQVKDHVIHVFVRPALTGFKKLLFENKYINSKKVLLYTPNHQRITDVDNNHYTSRPCGPQQ